jgi:uncharacterized protein YjbI with pentapeptide repeats
MLVFLYAIAVGLILGATVIAVRHGKKDARRRNLDTLPSVVAAGACGVTLLVVAVQLTTQPTGELRTTLAAGVVCGSVITVVFAAWLNYRRYRVEEARQLVERDKASLEQSKHRLEQAKVDLEQVKNQREHAKVADETFLSVVELLGHDDPRVRAGALHSAAGLAARRPDRAREVAELICMYLRNVPSDRPDGAVREAQRVLWRVVAQANSATPNVNDLDIDLSRATLDGFVFSQVTVRTLTLTGAHLTGNTALRGLRVNGPSQVVDLDGAAFDGDVWLQEAWLHTLSANGAVFRGGLSMERARVEHEVRLSDCSVTGDADLSGADFGKLICIGSTFQGKANLRRVRLRGGGSFLQTQFGGADFEQFASPYLVVLEEAHFKDSLRLNAAELPLVRLRGTTLGLAAAADDRLRLPSGWRVSRGERDDVRYLAA